MRLRHRLLVLLAVSSIAPATAISPAAACFPATACFPAAAFPSSARRLDARQDPSLPARIRACVPQAVTADPDRARDLVVEMQWTGDEAAPILRNNAAAPVAVKEIVLFDVAHGLAPETRLYGEGLQMLAQTAGTVAAPEDIGEYPDRSHYRLPEPEGFRRVYGVLALEPAGAPQFVAAFTTCTRFVGAFDISPARVRCTIDCEGLVIPAKSAWSLESLVVREGASRGELLGDLARRIACLDELCELSPDDWDVMRDLAEALIARSQTPQGQPDDGTRAASLLGALAVPFFGLRRGIGRPRG
jgi:hypothetical protein